MSTHQSQYFLRLSRCLAGVFQNRDQALADPAWFVHIRLWCHPVALFNEDSATFFIEQASAAFSQAPYRQRILRVRLIANELTAEYYALKDPSAFQGAAQDAAWLKTLTLDDLQSLSGSRLRVTVNSQVDAIRFEGRHYPGERCQFTVGGEGKWVELAFDAIAPLSDPEKTAFWMYDKGINPATGKVIWGAKNGPFKLAKIEDLSMQLMTSLIS